MASVLAVDRAATLEPGILRIPEDRATVVPPGHVLRTAYVSTDEIVLANRTPMAVGDVQVAMDRLRAASPGQPWPCPLGRWSGQTFEVYDGRHAFIAALMLGYRTLLVGWLAASAENDGC